MADPSDISPLTLNRLSVYLRCLRHLQSLGVERVSSHELANRYHLSSAQIRKDLAYFGEFGVRGVGYQVESLAHRLHQLLGLDTQHRLVIVGMGHLGRALARYPGFNDASFKVVAAFDIDPDKVGTRLGSIDIVHQRQLGKVLKERHARIAVITVPAEAAQEIFERLVRAGVRTILNFAPVLLKGPDDVRLKNVDMRIHLEEIAYFLQDWDEAGETERAEA